MVFKENINFKEPKRMMNEKQFRKYLISQPNRELLDTLKNRSYYGKNDIIAVEKEIQRRKSAKLLKSSAGEGKYYNNKW